MTATKTPSRGHRICGSHTRSAPAGLDIPSANPMPTPNADAPGGSDVPTAAAKVVPTPICAPPLLLEHYLSVYAALVDDIEAVRIAIANRLEHATRNGADADGIERGLGLTDEHPVVKVLATQLKALGTQEKEAVKALEREVRRHPLGPWLKSMQGVGDKQAGRLLAALNDPYWNDLHDRPRTVSELWAYCGYKPGQRRQKGQQSNWSSDAKMRTRLIAAASIKYTGKVEESGRVKMRSPYRDVYDNRRARSAVTHPEWSDGHSHNDALRVVAKAFLKDLWIESRRIHQEGP